MMQFQLRTPEKTNLRDLVTKMVAGILESLQRELDSDEFSTDTCRVLESPLTEAISHYVKAYDCCGKDELCTEGIQSESMPSPSDRIYMLLMPEGMEHFLETVSSKALEPVRQTLDIQASEALGRRVKASLRRSLSGHIYWNPLCGSLEICRISFPIDPWA